MVDEKMVHLYPKGAYLIGGKEIVEESENSDELLVKKIARSIEKKTASENSPKPGLW